MSRSHVIRVLLVLLVVLALAAPSAWAAPRQSRIEIGPLDFLARLWGSLTAIWAESGCWIDPNGGCLDDTPLPPGTDEGCKLDPNGGCVTVQSEASEPPPSPDEGCKLDPHGGCLPGS
jgi:hypothetical protein